MKKNIVCNSAPKPVGPYSQAFRAGNFLFISGTLPIDPLTGNLINGDIESMAHRILDNIKILLESENLSMSDIVKTTIYLKDMNLFSRVNSVYAEYFTDSFPARSAIGAASLPKNAEIEIEAIAVYESD